MELFTGSDTNLRHFAVRQHGLCKICDLKGRDLTDKGLPTGSLLKRLDHQLNALRQADPETCHTIVSDGKLPAAVLDDAVKERNNGATASGYVAITDDREIDVLFACIGIGCDKQLIRYQLGSAVEVYRVYRLIRRKGNYLLYIAVKGCINDILCTMDVGLDRFVWIVFTGRHLL